MADPWDFDTDQLVQELCTENRSWKPPSRGPRPDLDALKEKLIQQEVYGEIFLRYAGTEAQFFKDLGINTWSQQHFLRMAADQLRARSRTYRREVKGERTPEITEEAAALLASVEDAGHVFPPPRPEPAGPASLVAPATSAADEAPRKKRRLAPLNVSATPIHAAPVAIPNQADTVIGFAPVVWTEIQEAESTADDFEEGDIEPFVYVPHYYGTTPILADDFEPDVDPDDSDFGFVGEEDLEFSFMSGTSTKRPVGHRIAMSRAMKRYLRTNLEGAPAPGKRGRRARQVTPDVILEPFGESDSEDDGYDTETWEEMEAERLEREERTKEKEMLTKDEISALLEELIAELEDEWRNSKLPKLENKAYKIWNDARRRGSNRARLIQLAKKEAGDLDARLAKICDSISDDRSFQKADLPKHRQSLEPSVYSKMHSHWLVVVLSSLTEPDRPKPPARPRPQKAPKPKVIEDGVEVDELTSESEPEDISNFFVGDHDDAIMADPDPVATENEVVPMDCLGAAEDAQEKKPRLSNLDSPPVNEHEASVPADKHSVIDLTGDTPQKPRDPPASPSLAGSVPPIELPESTFNDPAAIAVLGIDHWFRLGDSKRLVITMLWNLDATTRSEMFALIGSFTLDRIEKELVFPSFQGNTPLNSQNDDGSQDLSLLYPACAFTRLFHIYSFPARKPEQLSLKRPLGKGAAKRVGKALVSLGEFCNFLRSISDTFPQPEKVLEDVQVDESSDLDAEPSPYKKRKQVKRDREARDLRENDKRRLEQQEERRRALRAQLASSDVVSGEKSRLIINETKEESHGLIYVTSQIASHIKDHQIQGVRFMWNQVTNNGGTSQGCLLAHTMGLGKTMQVICLLVAIAEASLSNDPSLFSQIPEELRDSKTLVLCPPGLVQNWCDELLRWAPPGILGPYYRISSDIKEDEKLDMVENWAKDGGVLIMGYDMFRTLAEAASDKIAQLLKDAPNIVVGDEAHRMKNPNSKLSIHTSGFKTKTRIAMTGSPLANSVTDYYAMVSWVAPNYLGPPREFASVYANPIQEGLWQDSRPQDKRRSLKLLKALKDTVAPKIHRMTMHALKDQLPSKKEFIIYVPLTKLQMEAYSLYMSYFSRADVQSQFPSLVHLFNQVNQLSMLLAHPHIFLTRLREIKDKHNEKSSAMATSSTGSKAQAGKESMLPLELVGLLIKTVNVRNVADHGLSYKIVVLLQILQEAKAHGDKVLLFSSSIPTLNFLENLMRTLKKPFSRLDGSTGIAKRQGMVADFNQNADEVYLISTTAGGVGLNIQGANRIVIMDFKWSPINEQQAIGRAYRIGQTKPVFVYWLIVGGTYEPKMHQKSIFKTQLASRVVDKKNPHAHASKYSSWTQPPEVMKRTDLSPAKGHDVILDAVLNSPAGANICKVMLGDLFEEEEPESQLSAEELKEAEFMVKANQLRITDPEAFAKMPQTYAATQLPPPPPPAIPPIGLRTPQPYSSGLIPQHYAPRAGASVANGQAPCSATSVPLPAHMVQLSQTQQPKPPAPPSSTPSAGDVNSLHTQAMTGALPGQGASHESNGGSNTAEAIPAQIHDPSTTPGVPQEAVEPVAGAGTAFRTLEKPKQPPPVQTPAEAFLALLKSRIDPTKMNSDPRTISRVADDFSAALQAKGLTGLPLQSIMRNIVEILTTKEAIWGAVMETGELKPVQLVAKNTAEIKETVDGFLERQSNQTPTAAAAKTPVATPRPPRTQDPSLNRLPTSLPQEAPSSGGQQPTRKEHDMQVMEDVIRRRKARKKRDRVKQPRLPDWAREGFETPPRHRAGDDPQTPVVLDD